MYRLFLRRSVERTFAKLARRDPQQLRAVGSKLQEVLADPHRFKNLRSPLQHLRRVHIESYVLVYSIDEDQKAVVVEDYDHHDRIYKR
jgi:mRNA-degrading endonuclease RelE of RelBE toxin-antitoxin system